MLFPSFLMLALVPVLASAAIFPTGTRVKLIDAKGFRKAMKENSTILVAFVAPWCGHCQKMAPEYSKAAKTLHPLVPLYAVDCDENKNLCADQGVQGFPTVKLFPRGNQKQPVVYPGERTARAFVDYVSRRIPHNVKKLSEVQDILNWVYEDNDVPRALLLTEDKRIPTMWKVLDNKFNKINFGIHRDKGMMTIMLGVPEGTKVVVYGPGSMEPTIYQGSTKYEALSQYFESILDGTTVLNVPNEQQAADQSQQDDSDLPPSMDSEQITLDEVLDGLRQEVINQMKDEREFISDSVTATTSPDIVIAETVAPPEPELNAENEADVTIPETKMDRTEENVVHTSTQEKPTPSEPTMVSSSSPAATESIATPLPAEPSVTENPGKGEIPSETSVTPEVSLEPESIVVATPSTGSEHSKDPEDVLLSNEEEDLEYCEEEEEIPEDEEAGSAENILHSNVVPPSETDSEKPRPTDEL